MSFEFKHQLKTLTHKACIKQKPATRQSHHLGLMAAGSPRGNQNTHEQQRSSLKLPTKFDSAKSPIMDFSKRNRDKLVQREKYSTSSHSIELSSSFSSRRLQRLLESTDWSAELDAQGSPTSPHIALPARSSDQSQKSAYYYSQELSSETRRSDTKKSARRSSQKRRSRTQTPSTSSIELVYDPLLRCYYDPVANKYYALAE
ncbi:unnamed protein product [Phytophthora lilii]|uniref:Unnamed protein product n=1 Tax=Phytophthora lilii TaxID=2077276 RepID=A0A9W6TKK9_9STRA|nr:unnamed protein product [Phytophthora lilii]